MWYLAGLFIFFCIISIIINIIYLKKYRKRYINIFDENIINLLNNNYNKLEIKRKIRLGSINRLRDYKIVPLEMDYNLHWTVHLAIDIIEIYGIKNDKEYLIFKINWSKDNAEKIKNIVSNINQYLNNITVLRLTIVRRCKNLSIITLFLYIALKS